MTRQLSCTWISNASAHRWTLSSLIGCSTVVSSRRQLHCSVVLWRQDSEKHPQRQSISTPESPQEQKKHEARSLLQRIRTGWHNLLDKDARLARRKHLQEEYHTSYWKDLQELNKTKGKLYVAADQLIKQDRASQVPDLLLQPLNPLSGADTTSEVHLRPLLQNKITLLTISMSVYADAHVKSFATLSRHLADSESHFQHIELNVTQDWIRSTIVRLSIPYIRRHVSLDRQKYYYLSLYHNVSHPLRSLHVTNKYLGWVYLVDTRGRIRWCAHGLAQPQEVASLIRLANELIQQQT